MRLIRYESGTDSKVWMKEENHAWNTCFFAVWFTEATGVFQGLDICPENHFSGLF